VDAAPVLAEPSALAEAVGGAGLVVVGMSPRWRHAGIGEARRALVRGARAAVLLVHRGPRPGLLAPRASRTRFTWTVETPYVQAVSSAPTSFANDRGLHARVRLGFPR
jgi:hypothetical protein